MSHDKTTAYVGRRSDNARVFVTIELRHREYEHGETVDHAGIGTALELSVTGTVVAHRGRTFSEAGQICDSLANVTTVPGFWTARDVQSLAQIWDRWHLNGMRAACAHMTLPADRSYKARRGVECEAGSGYRYGSAWLVEPLPADVLAEVERLMALPTGAVPDYA